MKRLVRRCAISIGIGTIFPAVYLGSYTAGWVREFPLPWGLYLWPTSVFLMATDGAENDYPFVAEVIGISLLANAMVWALLGLLCFGLIDWWRRDKGLARAFWVLTSLPDDVFPEDRQDAPPQKRKNL